jgi:hypothetical protein
VRSHFEELNHIQPVAIMKSNPVVEAATFERVPAVGAIREGIIEFEKVSRKNTSDLDSLAIDLGRERL